MTKKIAFTAIALARRRNILWSFAMFGGRLTPSLCSRPLSHQEIERR